MINDSTLHNLRLGREPYLPIIVLAKEWAPELGETIAALADLLLFDSAAGHLDNAGPEINGKRLGIGVSDKGEVRYVDAKEINALLALSHNSSDLQTMIGKIMNARIRDWWLASQCVADQTGNLNPARTVALNVLLVTREAAQNFAAQNQIAPPSWWPCPSPNRAPKRSPAKPREDAIRAKIVALPAKSMTTVEMENYARQQGVSRDRARKIIASIPDSHKLGRGKKRGKSAG